MTRTTAQWRTYGAILAAVALLVLSACGGAAAGGEVASAGGDATTADPAETDDTAPLDEDEQALVFAECMRDNGIDMPDPGPGQQGLVDAFQAVAGNYDQATQEQALTACADLIPQYQNQQHDPSDDDWILALTECLREQGLDVSDNPFDDAHSGKIDQTEFAAAMEVCNDVLTGGGQ
jgi:hypothetical protein